MNHWKLKLVVIVGALFLASSASAGETWVTFKSAKYGISMLLWKSAVLKSKEEKGGWGMLEAKRGDAVIWAIAKLGKPHTADEIEDYGIQVTGVASKYWKLISKTERTNGWVWTRVYEASDAKWVIRAVLGVGPKGSYLLILKTTKVDEQANRDAYAGWVKSVKLF